MIKIGICDDEIAIVKSIAKLTEAAIISTGFPAEITCATTNQETIYNMVKENELDILFLDVDFNNGGKNGIEFALDLRELNKDFKLVFTTGHFEYAFLSFKCKTFDYILKPIDVNKVVEVLTRLKSEFEESNLQLIKLNKDDLIRPKDILFIERNKSKAIVYTKDDTFETCYSLNNIENELPDSFVRVHRSYIVNQDKITRINKDEKTIYFTDNLSCPLGQFKHTNKEDLL